MHRFYSPLPPSQGTVVLTGSEAHHAADVLRVRAGEQVVVLNGSGGVFHCEVQAAGKGFLCLHILKHEQSAPPRNQVTLIQALPKGRIIEDIIQKATELGVARVIPLMTERVVARFDDAEAARKQQKWQSVAVEALKQCGSPWLPVIEKPLTLDQVRDTFDIELVGSLRPDARHAREYFRNLAAEATGLVRAAAWVGPEGDFTPAELDVIEARGARPISLGPLVLRCETAAVFCLSLINYELEDPGRGASSPAPAPGTASPGAPGV